MEVALVVVLLLVLFAKPIFDLGRQVLVVAKSNPSGLMKYLGASSAFALTCAFLPRMLIIVYMRHSGFWAYEVFGTERDAFAELGTNIVVNYLFLSLYMFSAAIVAVLDVDRPLRIVVFVINIVAVGVVFLLAWSKGAWVLAGAVLALCLVVAGYAAIWTALSVNAKAYFWWFPLVFAGVLLLFPYVSPSAASGLAEGGLRQMKVGGIDVQLCDPRDMTARTKCLGAHLLLRTPEKIYVTFPGDRRVFVATSEQYVLGYAP